VVTLAPVLNTIRADLLHGFFFKGWRARPASPKRKPAKEISVRVGRAKGRYKMNTKLRCDSGRVVASFDSNRKILVRRLKGSLHLLRSPRAICFDSSIIAQAEIMGCKSISVLDVETDVTYSVPFAEFLAKAVPLDRGYGRQLCLPLTYWAFSGGETWVAPAPVKQAAPEMEIAQFPLF